MGAVGNLRSHPVLSKGNFDQYSCVVDISVIHLHTEIHIAAAPASRPEKSKPLIVEDVVQIVDDSYDLHLFLITLYGVVGLWIDIDYIFDILDHGVRNTGMDTEEHVFRRDIFRNRDIIHIFSGRESSALKQVELFVVPGELHIDWISVSLLQPVEYFSHQRKKGRVLNQSFKGEAEKLILEVVHFVQGRCDCPVLDKGDGV